jgi:hypothetical protein
MHFGLFFIRFSELSETKQKTARYASVVLKTYRKGITPLL